jgi:hypothetical protein
VALLTLKTGSSSALGATRHREEPRRASRERGGEVVLLLFSAKAVQQIRRRSHMGSTVKIAVARDCGCRRSRRTVASDSFGHALEGFSWWASRRVGLGLIKHAKPTVAVGRAQLSPFQYSK